MLDRLIPQELNTDAVDNWSDDPLVAVGGDVLHWVDWSTDISKLHHSHCFQEDYNMVCREKLDLSLSCDPVEKVVK